MELTQCLVLLICSFLVFFANTMILLNQPVKSALSLVACMLCVCVIWILLDVEYFAYLLLFLYVGAVMTLFLFMVMMMNLSTYMLEDRMCYQRMLTVLLFTVVMPLIFLVGYLFFTSQLHMAILNVPDHIGLTGIRFVEFSMVLYHKYFWLLQGLAVILAVPVVFAAGVVHENRVSMTKRQNRRAQIMTCAQDRITLITKSSGRGCV